MWTFPTPLNRSLFVLGVFTILGFSSCSRSPAGQIERVLNKCAEVSKKASAAQADGVAKAGYVADNFQAIDVSGCPADFRAAFQAHVNSWRQFQIAAANNSLTNAVVEGVVAGVTENFSDFGAAQSGADTATRKIKETSV